MKLYYARGACSLADHIALEEGGFQFDVEAVDLKSKKTASGVDFTLINTKGYVPALVLDSGDVLTENIAVLDWIATQSPSLGIDGPLGRTRLLETLAYLSTEVHKGFKPIFVGGTDEDMERARGPIRQRLEWLAWRVKGPYLFGSRLSVADCYLFVMLQWTMKFGIGTADVLHELHKEMVALPAVQRAMEREGLHVLVADSAPQKRAGGA